MHKKRVMKGRRKKTDTTRALVNKLDRIYSRFIRMRDADNEGNISCVTCGKRFHWSEVHCGHWVKRQYMAVRWDERNTAAQCVSDNLYHGGKQDEFGKAIIDRYGLDAFNELLSKKHETKKWTRAELQELIETYTARVAALESSGKC
jgi:hypothetical protein